MKYLPAFISTVVEFILKSDKATSYTASNSIIVSSCFHFRLIHLGFIKYNKKKLRRKITNNIKYL